MDGLAEELAEDLGYAAPCTSGYVPPPSIPRGFVETPSGGLVFAGHNHVGAFQMKIKTVLQTLEEEGCDPLRMVAKTLVNEDSGLDVRSHVSACLSLAEFIAPKLARTELTGKDGAAIEFSDTERSARIAALLERGRARRDGPIDIDGEVVAPAGAADGSVLLPGGRPVLRGSRRRGKK